MTPHDLKINVAYDIAAKVAAEEMIPRIEVHPKRVSWWCAAHLVGADIENVRISLCFVYAEMSRTLQFKMPPEAVESYHHSSRELVRIADIVCAREIAKVN